MSQGAVCHSCGAQNPAGRDFCERCGEYLSWAPTAFTPAVMDRAETPSELEPGELREDGQVSTITEPRHQPAAPGDAGDPGGEGGGGHGTDEIEAAQEPEPDEPPVPVAAGAPPAAGHEEPLPDDVETVEAAAHEGGPGATVEEPAHEQATGDASLVLLPADPVVSASGIPAVEAGGTVAFSATVRNESAIVDNYDLAVFGLPEGWAIVSPAAAFLVPLGSGRGTTEQELRVDISPPREHHSTAGIWTFELLVRSRTYGTVAARAITQLEVLPFQAWAVEAVPPTSTGRLKGRFRAAVRNDGNADQVLYLVADGDEPSLKTKFDRESVQVPAGDVTITTLTVKPKFPKPIGRRTDHRIAVDAVATAPTPEEVEESNADRMKGRSKEEAAKLAKGVKIGPRGITLPKLPKPKNPLAKLKMDASTLAKLRGGPGAAALAPTARQIVYRQKPIIPLWLAVLVLLLCGGAIAAYLLWPEKHDAPRLIGLTEFAAEKRLREEKLVLAQPVRKVVAPAADPGDVVQQTPAPGTELDEGDSVTIVVAAPSGSVTVPRVVGRTREQSDQLLRKAGLELGAIQPADAPDAWVVRSQIPAARLAVRKGTAVRVFLKKPPPSKSEKAAAKKKAGGGAGAGGGGGGGGGGAKAITVPKVDGKPLQEYAEALDKLGLVPDVTRRFDRKDADAVIAVRPKAGTKVEKGDKVAVLASNGPHPLTVQTATGLLTLDPGADEIERIRGRAAEPTYSPNGNVLVYRAGNRLLIRGTAPGANPITLYGGDAVVRMPAIAPDSRTIAVIRRDDGDGNLCFGTTQEVDLDNQCLPDDNWDVVGRPSWRRDGRMVLVPARLSSNPAVRAIRVYRSRRAFSRDPLSWRGDTATKAGRPGFGVVSAAFSPGGTKLAAISNLDGAGYQVVLTDAFDIGLLEAQPTGLKACDVVWRPDGRELAVVQVDIECTSTVGLSVRAPTKDLSMAMPVRAKTSNPAYRP